MFDFFTIAAIVITFFLAGTVKGVIGLGLPSVSLGLLTAALVSLWLPAERSRRGGFETWQFLFLAAVASALVAGFVDSVGVAALVVLSLASFFAVQPAVSAGTRIVASLLALMLSVALVAHLIPGFDNPKVIDSVVLSPGAMPYSKHLNFDKAAVGLLLLAYAHHRIQNRAEWARVFKATVPVALALVATILPLSYLLGYVRWSPGPPPVLLFWAWTNLFFTCIAEEAIFRGFIQQRLTAALASRRFGITIALVVAALLFGLAHYAGGPKYVLLSTFAGLGYGWAWLRTHRIESSIAVHFFVNLVHFTLFSYPALAPAAP